MNVLRPTVLTLLLGCAAVLPLRSHAQAQIVISVGVPPPPLPIYVQPPIPEVGYIWTPGYWDYDDVFGYYWVPGTWVAPPRVGLLWTPGYWGFDNGAYVYRAGYWGNEVGFYGGVDYGFGYTGTGYAGGYWQGNNFFYNRAVTNIVNTNVTITNVYNKTVINNTTIDRVSYNGGQGGLSARPSPQQIAFARQPHVAATQVQQQHVQLARQDPKLREAENKGRPPIAATARPEKFSGAGVVAAKTAGTRPAGQAIPQGHNLSAPEQGKSDAGRVPIGHAGDHALPGQAGGHALPGQPGGHGLPGEVAPHAGAAADRKLNREQTSPPGAHPAERQGETHPAGHGLQPHAAPKRDVATPAAHPGREAEPRREAAPQQRPQPHEVARPREPENRPRVEEQRLRSEEARPREGRPQEGRPHEARPQEARPQQMRPQEARPEPRREAGPPRQFEAPRGGGGQPHPQGGGQPHGPAQQPHEQGHPPHP